MIEALENLPAISFTDDLTLQDVTGDLVEIYQTGYEESTGRQLRLEPADTEMLILKAIAVYIMQLLGYTDRAGKLNLLKYSYGSYLDNLAAYKSVTRLPAQQAETMVRFSVSAVQTSAVSVPEGTRVLSPAQTYFATAEYAEIAPGDEHVDVKCRCETAGVEGNGVPPGASMQLVNRLPYIQAAVNLTESRGGEDIESDDALRERTYLAPSSYSTAGPRDAYVYHARSYSSAVGSVAVDAPEDEPGTVYVRFLLQDGSLPNEALLQGMQEHLDDDTVRPLTDRVIVEAPGTLEYDIELTYYVARSRQSQAVSIQTAVAQAVADYAVWQTTEIGRDLNPVQLLARVANAGAKRADVLSPSFEVVPPDKVARTGSIKVTYGGLEDD